MGLHSETILLTGIPRSGTTLCCQLLNLFQNTVALHEPIDPALFLDEDASDALDIIRGFSDNVREQANRQNTVPSKQLNGRVPSNPVSNASNGRRTESVTLGELAIEKHLSERFTLVIKHNALFTALLERIIGVFEVRALIRNPLPVLASWRSVELPVSKGRLPMGERFSSHLSRSLSSQSDVFERQLIILKWFFDAYREIPSDQVIRYEQLIYSNGEVLTEISGTEPVEALNLNPQHKNSGLEDSELVNLAAELRTKPEIYAPFYNESDVELMLEEMLS